MLLAILALAFGPANTVAAVATGDAGVADTANCPTSNAGVAVGDRIDAIDDAEVFQQAETGASTLTLTKLAASATALLDQQLPGTQDAVDQLKTAANDGLERVKTATIDGLEYVENTTKGPVDYIIGSLPDEIKHPVESWLASAGSRVKYFYVPVGLPLLLLTLCTMLYTICFVVKHKRRGRTTKQMWTAARLQVHMVGHMMKSVGKDAAKTKSLPTPQGCRAAYQDSLTDTNDKTIQGLKKQVLDDRFNEADKDGNGTLDQGEAMDLVNKVIDEFGMTMKPGKEKFDKIFKHFDKNGDGMIDRGEFEPFWDMIFKLVIKQAEKDTEGQDQTEAQAKRQAHLKERGW